MSTEVADYSVKKKKLGCGIFVLYNEVFRGRRLGFWPRRTSSISSISTNKLSSFTNSKRIRRSGSDGTALLDTSILVRGELIPNKSEEKEKEKEKSKPKPKPKPVTEATSSSPINTVPHFQKVSFANGTTSSSSSNDSIKTSKVTITPIGRRHSTNSIDLESIRSETKGSTTLVRSSSAIPFSHMGNIIQSPHPTVNISTIVASNSLEYRKVSNACYNFSSNIVMGNIGRSNQEAQKAKQQYSHIYRALSKISDPEELKELGNEEYKKGRFAEALVLYDKAIALNPNKASYRSNKSAALTGLGRLLEAVFECIEAIRIESCYHRAHHRLGTLYLRLGEGKKALYHLKQSGPEAKLFEIERAQTLQSHIDKGNEAKRLKDWNTVLKETKSVISLGADSALQIFSLQAEALLKLHRHEDADTVLRSGPNFDIDDCTKFFGPVGNAELLVVRAQIDMAAGRFEDAVRAAQRAAHLDSNNETSCIVRRTKAVATARSNGNQLYNANKFSEASVAYSEGLDHDPRNSVLLCNRAACRYKLSQFEKAVEDSTNALILRPSYTKARLRRADCNAKMERWEASIQDYEMLIRETPGDEEVGRALFEAQIQVKKQRGEDVTGMKFGADLVVIANNERFRHYVTSPGMSVVLFSNKWSDKQALLHMSQLSKRYPSVNFLKVVVEEHPYLAKSEGVRSAPAFKIYKNGSRVKDIPGNNLELLESSVKFYT